MDAASHTGIDDVREIIENARYRPVLARTKVYIIDEVHMLSKQAFNGLLKTLEEPPDHVKFIFATTEIEKVPVTVRSRCQRFDLRRIEADRLVAHLSSICAKEEIAAEPEALAMIARAAEGSVRDALSLLDQAIAHARGSLRAEVKAEDLRQMLGLADRGRLIDLFADVMRGDIAAALATMKTSTIRGRSAAPARRACRIHPFRDPAQAGAGDGEGSGAERGGARSRRRIRAKSLAAGADARLAIAAEGPAGDQGFAAPAGRRRYDSRAARLCRRSADAGRSLAPARQFAASGDRGFLRNPGARSVPTGGNASAAARTLGAAVRSAPAPQPESAEPGLRLTRFEDVVVQAGAVRDIQLKLALERDVRLVRFEEGTIEFALVPGASPQLAQTLMRRLQEWTARPLDGCDFARDRRTEPEEQAEAAAAASLHGVRADPLVRAVMDVFPGAEIVAVREAEPAENAAAAEDIAYTEFGSP